jgi:hypothetical protein
MRQHLSVCRLLFLVEKVESVVWVEPEELVQVLEEVEEAD